MHPQLRFLSVLLVTLSIARAAAAHGVPPAATAMLAHDAEGVRLVRLSQGLAAREDGGFRFICPEVWGGDVSAASVSNAEGLALIAGDALFLVEADGRVLPHPAQLGRPIALASSGTSLFGLFPRAEQVELRRIDASSSQLLRTFDEPFTALAASEQRLGLLRVSQRTLVLQQLSLEGEPEQRVSWEAPSRVDYASLRAQAGQLYVSVWGIAAPWVTLARVDEHGAEPLEEAQSAIAGPLAFSGATLFVRDGALEQLGAGTALSAPDQHVTCIERLAGLDYACVNGGLWRMDAQGLGAPLFTLDSLRAPDLASLPPAARASCMTRWQDLALHLAELAQAEAEVSDDAGAASDAKPADGGHPARDAEPAGCALHGGHTQAGRRVPVLVLAACLIGGRRRRAPAHRRSC